MKVVSSKGMALLESQSYTQGCDEETFMLNAGRGIAYCTAEFIQQKGLGKSVLILAGKGNNAGDAYAAGTYLLGEGYRLVAYSASKDEEESPLCSKQKRLFIEKGGVLFEHALLSSIHNWDGLILDGLFGTGLNKIPQEPYASMIRWANKSKIPIIAVDIPSGLSGDTGEILGEAIQATLTVALGLPKIGFFLQSGWNTIGELKCVDFGLSKSLIEALPTPYRINEKDKRLKTLPPIKRNRHKYEAGVVICLAGSPGMPGAANLTALAALKSGSGMIKLCHTIGMEAELCSSPYELIKIPYETSETIRDSLNHAHAFAIGPGLGRTERIRSILAEICPNVPIPCVIDADALYFYAQKEFSVPKNTILTPHLGEMNRILGIQSKAVTLDYLNKCRQFVQEKEIVLVLKGGPSFILSNDGLIWINITGDPGMATAGSGDVLTGIIAGLLAQKMLPLEAALLGVCIHGYAGEFASKLMSPYCMIASDIIHCLPLAFKN